MTLSTELNITNDVKLPALGWQFSGPKPTLINTALKIAGYIPGLNLFVGVTRMLAFALDDNLSKHPNYPGQIIRGALEALQFTLALFLIDLTVTGYKHYSSSNPNALSNVKGKAYEIIDKAKG